MTILTKLLPDRVREFGMPRGAGPEITSSDVALAVAELEPFEADVLLAKHIGQEPEDLERVLFEIQNNILVSWGIKHNSGGDSMKRKYIRPMAECCWAEFVSGKPMSHEERAFRVGMSERGWHSSDYKATYDAAHGFLNDVSQDGHRKIKKVIG